MLNCRLKIQVTEGIRGVAAAAGEGRRECFFCKRLWI